MLYKLWEFIQLFLPYGLVLNIYKSRKSIPANIHTRSGQVLSAVMITKNYGVIYTNTVYIENRLKKLKEQKDSVDKINNQLLNEMNKLSFAEKEHLQDILMEDKNEI